MADEENLKPKGERLGQVRTGEKAMGYKAVPEESIIKCEYCAEPDWDGYIKPIYDGLTESKFGYEHDIGFTAEIEKNRLYITCRVEKEFIKPIFNECEFKINYCPMCGRKLKGD